MPLFCRFFLLTRPPVGAAAGCDLLILFLLHHKQDQKIVRSRPEPSAAPTEGDVRGIKKRQAFAGLPFFAVADAIISPGK
jgi:hypothetical protein